MCAHPLGVHMHSMLKLIIFVPASIIEDNAFMWFPLAFQVQYLDFYTCFIALLVVCREFLYPQFIMFDIMSLKLVHSIKDSLNAKRSLHLMVKFMFW